MVAGAVEGLATSSEAAFWADPASSTIQRFSEAGGTVADVAPSEGRVLAIGASGDSVAWAAYPPSETSADVWLVSQGGAPVLVAADAGLVLTIGVSSDAVVWTTMDGALFRLDTTSGSQPASLLDSGVLDIAVASDGVYVARVEPDSGGSTIEHIPTGSTTSTSLATVEELILQIAVDSTHVYWADADRVVRIPIE